MLAIINLKILYKTENSKENHKLFSFFLSLCIVYSVDRVIRIIMIYNFTVFKNKEINGRYNTDRKSNNKLYYEM